MEEKEVWLQCPPLSMHTTYTHTPTPPRGFLMANVKEFRAQGAHYGPVFAFQPLSRSVFLVGHFLALNSHV